MFRSTVPLLLTCTILVGCSPDPRSTKITPEFLENPARVQQVSNRLEPAARPIFARYLLARAVAASPLGQRAIPILTANGKDPATVGEALLLTERVMSLEAERDAKQEAASKLMAAAAASPEHETPEGIAAYNAAVHAYNAATEEFDAKIGRLRK